MLNNLGVVITRPAHQSAPLYRLLEGYQARPLLFPVLEIVDPTDLTQLRVVLAELKNCDIAIFISPNAVERAQKWINSAGGLPERFQIAAIGQGTARTLARFGLSADILPEKNFDSEALLACPELAEVCGRQIIIFRGQGGRELLGEELTRRGALVRYAEVYQRIPASPDSQELIARISQYDLHVAVVTSSEILRVFWDLLPVRGREWLSELAHLVVFSNHTATLGRNLGLRGPIHLARPATDQAIIEILCREFPGRNSLLN